MWLTNCEPNWLNISRRTSDSKLKQNSTHLLNVFSVQFVHKISETYMTDSLLEESSSTNVIR